MNAEIQSTTAERLSKVLPWSSAPTGERLEAYLRLISWLERTEKAVERRSAPDQYMGSGLQVNGR